MKRLTFNLQHRVMFVIFCSLFVLPSEVSLAQAPGELKNFDAIIFLRTTPSAVIMDGKLAQMGRFIGAGELTFRAGDQPGARIGTGPVVLRAANGHLLVGNMTWTLSAPVNGSGEGHIQVHWRDSVTFHNGLTVRNTGRFITNRPPGANDGLTLLTNASIVKASDSNKRR